jgi:hypothetical protein
MTDRSNSLRYHAATRQLYFRVMAHKKCDEACHDWTGRQHHKTESCFASRILDPADRTILVAVLLSQNAAPDPLNAEGRLMAGCGQAAAGRDVAPDSYFTSIA